MSPFDGRTRKPGRSATVSHLQLVKNDAPVSPPRATEARRRVVIVPLDDVAASSVPAPTVPRLAPAIAPVERRQEWPSRENREPFARLACTSCGVPARVDLIDLRLKRVHLSCDRCNRMWQDRIREDDRLRPRSGAQTR
jgi:hypothetical protein